MSRRWPDQLWIIRHGQSAGNVARDLADAAGLPSIDIAERDMDVTLSELGCRQARALGEWLARAGDPPTAVLSSPYIRACETAKTALGAAGFDVEIVVDERLREREFGVLDRLTRLGIEQQRPEEAEARARLGKFYHRPPGGESWCDVALRTRSVLDSIALQQAGGRVLVVAHQVVILMVRYVLEHLDEAEILAIDRAEEIANCSLTTFEHDPDLAEGGGMRLRRFNEVVALEEAGEPVTEEDDAPTAPR